jgi:hypothetical protein
VDNRYLLAADDNYRRMIKAQIFKNNLTTFSVNVLEQIAKIIFFQEDITIFYVTKAADDVLEVHVNQNLSDETLAFLQSFKVDSFGRKIFYFPWPPSIKTISVEVE